MGRLKTNVTDHRLAPYRPQSPGEDGADLDYEKARKSLVIYHLPFVICHFEDAAKSDNKCQMSNDI
jgi:hypothetical protein